MPHGLIEHHDPATVADTAYPPPRNWLTSTEANLSGAS